MFQGSKIAEEQGFGVKTQPHRVRGNFGPPLAQNCYFALDCVEFAHNISNLCSKIVRN